MDNLTPDQRRKNMQAIKSKDTKDEIRLAKALWRLGIRYRKNNRKVYGRPDITLKNKIAVFVDSEFFHGKDWSNQKLRLKSNTSYWIPKIERNMQRDRDVNERLKAEGWTVLRFWSQEIKKNLEECVAVIKEAIEEKSGAAK